MLVELLRNVFELGDGVELVEARHELRDEEVGVLRDNRSQQLKMSCTHSSPHSARQEGGNVAPGVGGAVVGAPPRLEELKGLE